MPLHQAVPTYTVNCSELCLPYTAESKFQLFLVIALIDN